MINYRLFRLARFNQISRFRTLTAVRYVDRCSTVTRVGTGVNNTNTLNVAPNRTETYLIELGLNVKCNLKT